MTREEALQIIRYYGGVMEQQLGRFSAAPESALPCDKETIKTAIRTYMLGLEHDGDLDGETASALRLAYASLGSFVPDEEAAQIREMERLTAPGEAEADAAEAAVPVAAPGWKRLINCIVDLGVGLMLVTIVHSLVFHGTKAILAFVIGYGAYFLLFELACQRTVGKVVTGTMVVDENGSKPRAWQILVRTFARMVPLEPLSGLGGIAGAPRWWHDRWSKTLVVNTPRV